MLQPVGVFTVAAIGRTTRRLYIGGGDGLRAKRPQAGHGMGSPRADFHIQRLDDGAALTRPVILERQDQALKGLGIKLLHVEFARVASGCNEKAPVYPLAFRYTARIRQQLRIRAADLTIRASVALIRRTAGGSMQPYSHRNSARINLRRQYVAPADISW
ncbi:hypothetical protein SODG_003259 [Sodalis praecaptivus]